MLHLTFENRKLISSMLAHGNKCWEIAEAIGCDSTTISKEIKKNRVISKEAATDRKVLCKILDRFPYVCSDCKHKYTNCVLTQMVYKADLAQKKYEYRLHELRKGLNLTKEEYNLLVFFIKDGLEKKKSLYTILKESKVPISLPTVYRYIEEKKIPITKMDLPYAVTYKKRKKQIKEYDYPNNNIDRSNRTFIDYLAYMKSHINELTVQMDFLGSIKSDSKSILTLTIPMIHFVFIFLVENKNSSKVVGVFNDLERRMGYHKFCEIFPSILTDRDPCFSDIKGIEWSPDYGARRSFIFFCDAFRSNQKANVENMNKQLRKFFPKRKSIDHLKEGDVLTINRLINGSKLHSLDGRSPEEVFITLFGLETYTAVFGE